LPFCNPSLLSTKPMPSTHPHGLSRRANHAILGATLAFSAVGTVVLLVLAPRLSVVAAAVATLVYGTTLLASSLFSFLYHVLERAKRRSLFRLLDHGAIFLLIAGTYTPLTVIAARGSWSFVVLGTIWVVAFLGILLKILLSHEWDQVFVWVYLALGCAFVLDLQGVLAALPIQAMTLVALGGAAFIAGALVYWRDVGRWTDAIWHGLVLVGCVTHYFAIVSILPAA
jgi:hemolysin III